MIDDNSSRVVLKHIFDSTCVASASASVLGVLIGARLSALQYTAENAHIKPTNKNGWFKYHRFKNYAMILGGVREGLAYALKFGVLTGAYFSIDSGLDVLQDKVQPWNGSLAGVVVSWLFSICYRFGKSDTRKALAAGLLCGSVYSGSYYLEKYLQGLSPSDVKIKYRTVVVD